MCAEPERGLDQEAATVGTLWFDSSTWGDFFRQNLYV